MKERYRLIGDMLSSRRFTKLARNLTHRTTDPSLHFLFSGNILERIAVHRMVYSYLQDHSILLRWSVRPILEYAVQVWQDIPDYLSDRIESVQKGHLNPYILTISTVKHCRQPTKLHLPTQASSYVINLWLRWQTPVTTPLSCLVSTAYKELILITLDLVLPDHLISS